MKSDHSIGTSKPSLCLIINCGPCEDFIEKCLSSVLSQSVRTWRAYVTVDPCGDDTYAMAIRYAGNDPRIHVKRNATRRYSLDNQIAAIARSGTNPEDIIVSLDGDDWFAHDEALAVIADTYEQSGCWMTYGSWVPHVPGGDPGMWPPYPDGTVDFRHIRWLGTAVRTWKRWLWERLGVADLRDDAGRLFRISEDRAIMIPLLEMCGTERARHIAEPIMAYRQQTVYGEQMSAEEARNVAIIRSREPYGRICRTQSLLPRASTSFQAIGIRT